MERARRGDWRLLNAVPAGMFTVPCDSMGAFAAERRAKRAG